MCKRDTHLEGLLDIDRVFGAHFEVGNIVLRLTPRLGTFCAHRSTLQVDLVTEHHKREVLRITRRRLFIALLVSLLEESNAPE